MERVFNKKNVILFIAYFTILFGIRLYQVYTLQNLIEFLLLLFSIPVIIIFGLKALIYCAIIFISCLMHLNHNTLYIALVIYTISAFLTRKYLIPLTIIYHLNTLVVFAFDRITMNINVIIYYSLCLIIFLWIFNYPKIKKTELNLTPDEEFIIKELASGKQLKEIDKFSKNTKTEKIKSACKRNNIIDKNELIFIYKMGMNP